MSLEEALVCHCAPTLAGLKVASLFRRRAGGDSRPELVRLRQQLAARGLSLCVLRRQNGSRLLYVYRPAALERLLAREEVRRFLAERGYPEGAGRCLGELARRLAGRAPFPHEIGLFLGYPLEDVEGFIHHGGRHSRCVGCWKVYGDVAAARERFARYAACTRCYLAQYHRGTPLARLAVAG